MWIVVQFLIGCALLAWGATRFINASSQLATRLGLPTVVVGIVLVGFGTSLPELVVSTVAALHGEAKLAFGNAIGSNITNMGLVAGLAALWIPLSIHSRLLKRELPILIAASLMVGVLCFDAHLTRLDGGLMVLLLLVHIVAMFRIKHAPDLSLEASSEASAATTSLKTTLSKISPETTSSETLSEKSSGASPEISSSNQIPVPSTESAPKPAPLWGPLIWWLIGLAVLVGSSELLVNSAVAIADWLGISQWVIGLTVVAIGTSLPELAATLVSAWRGQPDLAMGNIIGSGIFNLLGVMGVPALIAPSNLPYSLLWRDYPVMLGLTLLVMILSLLPLQKAQLGRLKQAQLGRLEGLFLCLVYIGYLVWVVRTVHSA